MIKFVKKNKKTCWSWFYQIVLRNLSDFCDLCQELAYEVLGTILLIVEKIAYSLES
jgi:hypothetical protein